MPKTSEAPDTATGSTASALVRAMELQGEKSPELAAKQARLLQKLRADTSAAPPTGSNDSATSEPGAKLPPAPKREAFASAEAWEEAMSRYHWTVGRNAGLRRSSASPQPSNSTADK